MKSKLFFCLALVLSAVLSGCVSAPSPKAIAAERVRPFIAALKAYHHDTGDYPQQLNDLGPRYLATNVPWRGSFTDEAHFWAVSYDRVSRDSYQVGYYSVPCSEATFENGRLVFAGGPNYK